MIEIGRTVTWLTVASYPDGIIGFLDQTNRTLAGAVGPVT